MEENIDGLASFRSSTGKMLRDSLRQLVYIEKGKILTDQYLSVKSINISPIKIIFMLAPDVANYLNMIRVLLRIPSFISVSKQYADQKDNLERNW